MSADTTTLRYGVIGVGSVGLTIAAHVAQADHDISVYCLLKALEKTVRRARLREIPR